MGGERLVGVVVKERLINRERKQSFLTFPYYGTAGSQGHLALGMMMLCLEVGGKTTGGAARSGIFSKNGHTVTGMRSDFPPPLKCRCAALGMPSGRACLLAGLGREGSSAIFAFFPALCGMLLVMSHLLQTGEHVLRLPQPFMSTRGRLLRQ